jgi:diguanylate cyclase (GGDEF)-like protein
LFDSSSKPPFFIRVRNFLRAVALVLKNGPEGLLYDETTRLYTKASFMNFALGMLNMSARTNAPVSVIMADADGFKRINDEFGHLVGDRFLRQSAEIFTNVLRGYDLIGRFGGDEFIVLLPISHIKAKGLIDRIKRRLKEDFLTWSFGVAEIQLPSFNGASGRNRVEETRLLGASLEEAMVVADRRMYREKAKKKAQR